MMRNTLQQMVDPEILEGMQQLPPELTRGGPIDQAYLSLREMIKGMEQAPFESAIMTMEEKRVHAEGRDLRFFIYQPTNMDQHSDPHPAGMEDCYAGLVWTAQHAEELGIDKHTIAVCGESAGGGMAARTVLLNRERKGVDIAFQLLKCPMLDNTHDTPSGRLSGYLGWDREASLWGWNAYLGGDLGKAATPLQSPSRATDLSGLPPAYVYVGAVELFRDECIAYAQRLMQAGVPTELYVAPGVSHGGERMSPLAKVSQTANNLMVDALKRGLGK